MSFYINRNHLQVIYKVVTIYKNLLKLIEIDFNRRNQMIFRVLHYGV